MCCHATKHISVHHYGLAQQTISQQGSRFKFMLLGISVRGGSPVLRVAFWFAERHSTRLILILAPWSRDRLSTSTSLQMLHFVPRNAGDPCVQPFQFLVFCWRGSYYRASSTRGNCSCPPHQINLYRSMLYSPSALRPPVEPGTGLEY